MLKKETFVFAIEAIENQIKKDCAVAEQLGRVFPNCHVADLMPDNELVSNALIRVLQELMNDTELCENGYSWITYFCFELDFGRENGRLKVWNDGEEVPLLNAGQLYDYLLTLSEL